MLRGMRVTGWLSVPCLFSLLAVFATATSYKLTHLSEYFRTAWLITPESSVPGPTFVAIGIVPGLEAMIVVTLLFPRWRRLGASLSIVLLLMFTLTLASRHEMVRLLADCACNWPALKFLAPASIETMFIRNFILLAIALIVYLGTLTARVGDRR